MAVITSPFGFSATTTPAMVFANQSQFEMGNTAALAPLAAEQTLSTQMLLVELAGALEQLMLGYETYAGSANGNGNAAAPSLGSSQPGSSSASYAPAGNGPNLPTGSPSKVDDFIKLAEAQQGKPYVFGAAGDNAFDCSGLVDWALNHAGVKVPRLTADGYMQRFKDSSVDKNSLKPGDLIFYHYPNNRGIPDGHASHIEIYIGNGMTVGAEGTKAGIRTQKVNWKAFIGAERVPGLYN